VIGKGQGHGLSLSRLGPPFPGNEGSHISAYEPDLPGSEAPESGTPCDAISGFAWG
jgi:hypothetical protein